MKDLEFKISLVRPQRLVFIACSSFGCSTIKKKSLNIISQNHEEFKISVQWFRLEDSIYKVHSSGKQSVIIKIEISPVPTLLPQTNERHRSQCYGKTLEVCY